MYRSHAVSSNNNTPKSSRPGRRRVSFAPNSKLTVFKPRTPVNNNASRDKRLTRPSAVHLFGGGRNNNPVDPHGFTNNSSRIGQQRQSIHLSETRAAFRTPAKHHYLKAATDEKEDKNSKLLNKHIAATKSGVNKFQEFPPFSLRKSVLKSKNQVIDAAAVPELLQKKKQEQEQAMIHEEKKVFVKKGISFMASQFNSGTASNTFGFISDPKSFETVDPDNEHFRFTVDLSEFHNEQIELRVKGRTLIVEGKRPQQEPWVTERIVKETIELPPHIHADNLRIDRDTKGVLYFQEAWKF